LLSIISAYKSLSESKKTMIYFSISSFIYSLCLMATNIVVIRWIPAREMGLWNTLFVITSYTFILQLGVINGLNRELPYYLGKNDIDKAYQLAANGLFVAMIAGMISLILALFSFVYAIWFYNADILTLFTLLAISFIVIIYFYQNYLIVTYRTNSAFRKLSNVYLINSLIILVSLILVWKYRYNGFLVRSVVLSIFLTLGLHLFRPIKKIKPVYKKEHFLTLLKTGIPLFLGGYIGGLAKTINRVFLANFAGIIYVGYYSPALAILVVMNMFPAQVAQYLYPQMSFEYGKTGNKQKLWGWVWKSTFGLILILLPVGIAAWFILPWAIQNFFPAYTSGIFAAQLAVISGILTGSLVGINVLNSIKAFKTIILLNSFKLILNVVLMYFGLKYFEPLTGVSLGLVVSDLIYFILGLYVCHYNLYKR